MPIPKVLVTGVYLSDKPTNVATIVGELASSRGYEVHQRWAALGRRPLETVRNVTSMTVSAGAKYSLITRLIEPVALSEYEYLLICDDDVQFPPRFLDRYLGHQAAFDLAMAQPARTVDSRMDHPITARQPGLRARRTLFVESGPVISIHRAAFDLVLPFDPASPMGWGYEAIWAWELNRRGLRLGIIDATPVEHRMRPTASFYDAAATMEQCRRMLDARPHLPLEQCLVVLEVAAEHGG